jgi:hypothetical protein
MVEHVFDKLVWWRSERRAFAGDKFHLTLRLVNGKFCPFLHRVRDLVPEALPAGEGGFRPPARRPAVPVAVAHLGWYNARTGP